MYIYIVSPYSTYGSAIHPDTIKYISVSAYTIEQKNWPIPGWLKVLLIIAFLCLLIGSKLFACNIFTILYKYWMQYLHIDSTFRWQYLHV